MTASTRSKPDLCNVRDNSTPFLGSAVCASVTNMVNDSTIASLETGAVRAENRCVGTATIGASRKPALGENGDGSRLVYRLGIGVDNRGAARVGSLPRGMSCHCLICSQRLHWSESSNSRMVHNPRMGLRPHSNAWYDRLATLQQGYYYPWRSRIAPGNGQEAYVDRANSRAYHT